MITSYVNCLLNAEEAAPLSTRWRINITARSGGSGSWSHCAEMEMRETVFGADQCTGGTPSASHNNAAAGNLTDNNLTSKWTSGTGALPINLQYDFATAKTIRGILMRNYDNTSGSDMPTAFNVQYYDFAAAAWVTYWSDISGVGWGFNWSRVFGKFDPSLPGYQRWRLSIKAVQAAGSWPSVAELQFRETAGGADVTSATDNDVLVSSGSNPHFAFNNVNTDRWVAANGTLPAYVGYRFPDQKTITEVSMRASTTPGDTPTSCDVQYWDPDLGAWVTSWSFTTPATWTSGLTRVFTKP